MRRVSAFFAALFAVFAGVAVNAAPADPPVPPGRDPGGRAVALIGGGIDYTRANIAQMLARDGEGEIIGYDFIDDDRRPYASSGDTLTAELLLQEGQAATLIVLRANLAATVAAGRAIRYSAESPSRITLFAEPLSNVDHAALVTAAASRFTEQLFVAVLSADSGSVEVAQRSNLVVVTPAGQPARLADLAVAVEDVPHGFPADRAASLAGARIAALAARLRAVEPGLSPAGLRTRILKLAVPDGDAPSGPRVISDPRRYFWLE
jgi:hypothetical protein